MREPTFFILTALTDGRKHGYGLISEADRLSSGRMRLKVGTLYAALDRLENEGFVTPDGDEIVEGRLRRYYALTDSGVAALEAEVIRLESNAAEARIRLRARRASPRRAQGLA